MSRSTYGSGTFFEEGETEASPRLICTYFSSDEFSISTSKCIADEWIVSTKSFSNELAVDVTAANATIEDPEVMPDVRSIYKPGMCVQRLNQLMYRQQQRPRDNNLEFWRNLVAEFFARNAKKRLCFSLNKCRQQIGGWCCDICKVRPTAGFEISADAKLKESVHETARVVHEGRLRVVFSSDLKICIWEFCCSFHEVLINRRSITPQVHQLREAIKKYQAFAESCSGIATEEFHRNSNRFASSIRGIARFWTSQ
ncbi:hypothetical protein K7X08_021593 [Anisodus acutangulus]|uniref:Uncharacterized protein n=1 Tax=Anisodus acutangulus TaxID=402998 RepID=A0A9Q1M7X6_9SOLA|nr:hypothetical protein K7X08_021593 [Anisodus acutangulus]